jgi:hypothetical protein
MWLALGGCRITDEVLEWPPDSFALTDVIRATTATSGAQPLQIAEPSERLSEAIDIIDEIVRTRTRQAHPYSTRLSPRRATTGRAKARLARLVRGVLRSTLEQRRTRLAREVDHHP